MLTDNQAAILRFVHDSESDVFFDDLADRFGRPDSVPRIHFLITSGFISERMLPHTVSLSSAGLAALDEYDSDCAKQAEQRAYDERNQHSQNALEDVHWRKDARRSWVQWTITTILSVASFFAGAIVEVLTGFMQWVLSLLH